MAARRVRKAPGAARFASRLLRWHARHGRHDLPWQHPRTPYRIWVAEVMLQQTQVATVIPYYHRFLCRFPDVQALARARLDAVLTLWSGLGYYARARNLHRAAALVVARHGGKFPRDFESVAALPGIGRSTAGAILAQGWGARYPILEGNARRVLARHAGVRGWPGAPAVASRLWRIAEARLPHARLADYTQAVMDLGATLCTPRAPACARCPVAADCVARAGNLTARIPQPRPRRERPRRHARMLLIQNEAGELLLERRPARGIWGGLWCPPLLPGKAARETVIPVYGGLSLEAARALPAVEHAFTHFDLTLVPLRLRSLREETRPGGETGWVKLSRLPRLGLPAPVRALLSSLQEP